MAHVPTINIAATDYDDASKINVDATTGEDSSSSFFKAWFDNYGGRHNTTFNISDEVKIYTDDGTQNHVFLGTINDINFTGKGQVEQVVVSGRDYTSLFQDVTIEPVVFNNQEISVIVTELITNNASGITTNNVTPTTTTLDHIAFNHKNLFDALVELAVLSGFYFYVDTDKDLNFVKKESVSSGFTIDNTNTRDVKFRLNDREIYNRVWVYGDRVLTKFQNTFTGDGAGSVFQLDFKPHNTEVIVNSVTFQGGVFELLSVIPSGVQYLVDFDQAKIIFTSGTDPGYNIPGNTSGITINADRDAPIVKFVEDSDSVALYGKKHKVISDKTITDPQQAKSVALGFINDNSSLKKIGEGGLQDIAYMVPGNTIIADFPNQDVNSEVFTILEFKYRFDKNSIHREQTTTVKFSKKLLDVTDTIKQILLDLKQLQAQDLLDTDIITRLMPGTGSAGLKVLDWTVRERGIGSSFVLGHNVNGRLGTVGAGSLQPILGDQRVAWSGATVLKSGGD